MDQRTPRAVDDRPPAAADSECADLEKPCQVNSRPKKRPQQWPLLALATVLIGVQPMAVEFGQTHAHSADWCAELFEQAPEGAVSDTALRARARGHHIQLVASAREAQRRGDAATALDAYMQLYVLADDPGLQTVARDALVDDASRDWPSGFRSRFLTTLSPLVLNAAREHQVLPSITLAQAVLESGWGRSQLTRDYHNLFGVKAGRSSQRIRMASHEHMRGRLRPSHQTFRRYESKAHSIADHAELLSTDRRYAHARAHWTDRHRFIEAIAPRYASSPSYSSAVNNIIELYDLDRWDELIVKAVENDHQVNVPVTTADAGTEPEEEASDTGLPPFDG
jgi:flagellum-specific peptidoglycan hydrolase FlgJ